ncbi:hypothetical protein POG20_18365, partial [Blautia wexlerae]|nr:hypothetical protein [Blautia wexlerae]
HKMNKGLTHRKTRQPLLMKLHVSFKVPVHLLFSEREALRPGSSFEAKASLKVLNGHRRRRERHCPCPAFGNRRL